MRDTDRRKRKAEAVRKELESVKRQEQRLAKAASRAKEVSMTERLEEKIPEKLRKTLEKAFCRAFGIVFEKGTRLIEKGFAKEDREEEYEIRNFAVELRGTRQELRKLQKNVGRAGLRNMAITTAEGAGLGALGIGLPDILIFTGVLLKGVYETAIGYGFPYDTPEEQMRILKMLETAVSKGAEWERLNAEVDADLRQGGLPCGRAELEAQMERTANAFAADMLLLKAIQGLPIVGIAGGMGNPVYYHRVMKYVSLKYRKRYLLRLERDAGQKG